MQRLYAHATAGLVATVTAALVAVPALPADPVPPPHVVVQDVRLTAMVPPGGLITSFLHNQTIYCSIICPLLSNTATTAVATLLQSPGVLFTALQSENPLRAIGAAAASVTGPTTVAIEKAIEADAAIPAKRALNAFEVAVVGLLNIVPAVTGGPTAILNAIEQARQDTFGALNAPVVANPAPTVMPHGIVEIAVVQAINVVAAVIFPAFNDVLGGVFQVPDAVAQELAATGNPVRAAIAGVRTAIAVVTAATTVIADAVRTAVTTVATSAQAVSVKPVASVKRSVSATAPATSASPVGPTGTAAASGPVSPRVGQLHKPLLAATSVSPETDGKKGKPAAHAGSSRDAGHPTSHARGKG